MRVRPSRSTASRYRRSPACPSLSSARELLASGETARKRTVESLDQLTVREAQIARLARDGLSNPEIGARLFISPRTVEYHLHKVYGKLDITSRSELAGKAGAALTI